LLAGAALLRRFLICCFLACCSFHQVAHGVDRPAIRLHVDATDHARNILHVTEVIPVTPGPLTLVYPEWIPGNHRPSGPVANLTGIRFQGSGKDLTWVRDPVDMYAFHLQIPTDVHSITASFDQLTYEGSAGASGASASTQLLDINWNQVVLYPAGNNSDAVRIAPSIDLPSSWRQATALVPLFQSGSGNKRTIGFRETSLTTLVDSPLIAGQHFRRIELTTEAPPHALDMVAESVAALQISTADIAAYKNLVAQAGALFGARHYEHYDFLLTLSDEVGHHGLEHHESSDNSVGERTLIDPKRRLLEAGLLPHEYSHSWNGKYRRPAGLATANYQQPMIGDLLWVYEGLTDYLGNVLTARSGLWSPEEYREQLAETAATMDHTAGRSWRPLEDTAVSVQLLRMMGPEWQSWRRSLDYYPEGELIWLEVDARIRQLTNGKRSLNDFCRIFHGGQSGPPMVLPYTFDDLVKTLNEVAPFDWPSLLRERVKTIELRAPLEGIARGGWQLMYNDQPNLMVQTSEKISERVNLLFSLGFALDKHGEFIDVVAGSPAYAAGVGPGMKLLAINSRRWSRERLHDAIQTAKTAHQPIELLIENKQFFRTYTIPYYEGEKYPHLERASSEPDRLSDILKPLAH
jgi:predicted metalloprotease with PDZ domain